MDFDSSSAFPRPAPPVDLPAPVPPPLDGPQGLVAEPKPKVPLPPVRAAELGGLAVIVAMAEVLLWPGTGGTGEALFFVLAPLTLACVARGRAWSGRLLVIIALIALIAARSVWESTAGTVLVGSALVLAFGAALRSKESFVPELVASALATLAAAVRHVPHFAVGGARLAVPRRLARFAWMTVLVPVAVVAIFGLVFTAANPLLQGWAGALLEEIFARSWLPSLPHVAFWMIAIVVGVVLLRPLVRELGFCARLGPGHRLEPRELTTTSAALAMSRNVLVAVNVLFFAYSALDAVYLWGGAPPPGMDHAVYAHHGATWLTVTLALSTLVLGFIFRGAINFDPRARPLRILAYVWAAQNLVIAAGTFRRIAMYVSYSGLTELRILGVFGSALVTVGFVLIVIKLARARPRTMLWLVRRQLDALAVATVLFVALPTRAIVTAFNVARIEENQLRPLLHFFAQKTSAEGMAEVVALLEHRAPVVRAGAAALLADYDDALQEEERANPRWTEWEGSRRSALRRLAAARPKIDALVPSRGARAVAKRELRALSDAANDDDAHE